MDKEEAIQYVVKQLGKYQDRNTIITVLCEKFGIDWQTAKKFVDEVEFQHGRSIATRQSPLVVLIGIMIVIGGAVLAVDGSLVFIDLVFPPANASVLDTALGMRDFIIKGGEVVGGVAMVIGGLIGTWNTLSKMLPKEK